MYAQTNTLSLLLDKTRKNIMAVTSQPFIEPGQKNIRDKNGFIEKQRWSGKYP